MLDLLLQLLHFLHLLEDGSDCQSFPPLPSYHLLCEFEALEDVEAVGAIHHSVLEVFVELLKTRAEEHLNWKHLAEVKGKLRQPAVVLEALENSYCFDVQSLDLFVFVNYREEKSHGFCKASPTVVVKLFKDLL